MRGCHCPFVQPEECPSHLSFFGEWYAASAALAPPAVLLYHTLCHLPSGLAPDKQVLSYHVPEALVWVRKTFFCEVASEDYCWVLHFRCCQQLACRS